MAPVQVMIVEDQAVQAVSKYSCFGNRCRRKSPCLFHTSLHTSLHTLSLVGATSALLVVGFLLLAVNPFWLAWQWNPFWLCAWAVVCAVCLFSLTMLLLLFCLVWRCIYTATPLSPDLVSIGVHTLCLQTWSPYLWNRPRSPYPIVCQSHMLNYH